MKTSEKALSFFALHILLVIYSCSGIMSKFAAGEAFLSVRFCICYGIEIALLGIYFFGWQRVIKKIPLSVAYANKAVTVLWGTVWGAMLFNEHITVRHLVGMTVIMAGVFLYSSDSEV